MRKPSAALVFKVTCVLITFLLLGQVSLFFFFHCDFHDDNENFKLWKDKTRGLTKKIENLKETLRQQQLENESQLKIIESLRKRNKQISKLLQLSENVEQFVLQEDFGRQDQKETNREFPKGYQPKTEFEVIPYDAWVHRGTYHLKDGLSGNPAEKPYGNRGQEHSQVINLAVETINKDFENNDMSTSALDLVDGLGRTDRLLGSEYNLYFRTANGNVYRRVKLHRPFAPLHLVGDVETLDTNKEWINIILPLSGQTEKLKYFLKRYFEVVILDRRIFLTVVYFGRQGRGEVESMLENSTRFFNYTDYKLLFSDNQFSRGLGLQKGAVAWDKGNAIMFFCDVDIYFSSDFLERCRLYTEPGVRVYYPVVFSLYNPVIVYGGVAPEQSQMFRVQKESGYWRDFGFGMTCLYQNDFFTIGGFDLSIKGWGKEDVELYKKFVRSELKIVRAPDRGLFHIWHKKHCNHSLTGSQYIACLNSKVKNEASHSQLGLLAFGKRIFDNESPNWIAELMPGSQKENSSKNIPDVDHKNLNGSKNSSNAVG